MKAPLLLMLLIVALGSPAAGVTQENETRLVEAATACIRGYPRLTIFDFVTADVNDGTVTLTGKVTLEQKREEIARRIGALEGVRTVRNRIELLPASGSDNALRRKTARAIYGNAAFWRYAALASPPIHILVEHGDVTLIGEVPTEWERALAQSLATGQGERSVTNGLRTPVAER